MAPTMRAVLGFIAAAISVLTFHQAMWWLLHLAGTMPLAPYPMGPTQPLGVPLILSLCFWGGLYGAVFGLVMPSLRIPLWLAGLITGLIAACVGMFIVTAIKGQPINLSAPALTNQILINGFWGIGLGLIAPLLIRSVPSTARARGA